jgi:hypothetical protein
MTCNAIRSKKYTRIILKKNAEFFNENQKFVLVYIDDLLIFSKTYKDIFTRSYSKKILRNKIYLQKKMKMPTLICYLER